MKLLFAIPVLLSTLIGSISEASAGQHFQCKNGSLAAYLTLQNQSTFTSSSVNECNAGPGDDVSNCHIVEYQYEVKQGFIQYQNYQQKTVKQQLQLQRFQNTNSLFSGFTSVTFNSERMDQLSVEPSENNPNTYAIELIEFLGSRPTAQNIGRTEFLCQAMM